MSASTAANVGGPRGSLRRAPRLTPPGEQSPPSPSTRSGSVEIVRLADRLDQPVVRELESARQALLLAAQEVLALELQDRGVRNSSRLGGSEELAVSRPDRRDEAVLELSSQLRFADTGRRCRRHDGLRVVTREHFVDVAEALQVMLVDHVDIRGQRRPEVVADDLEMHGLDELALHLDGLAAACVDAKLAEVRDELIRDPGGEAPPSRLERARRGPQGSVSTEPLEPKARYPREEVEIGIEVRQVVLSEREHDVKVWVVLQRLRQLLEELLRCSQNSGYTVKSSSNWSKSTPRGKRRPRESWSGAAP